MVCASYVQNTIFGIYFFARSLYLFPSSHLIFLFGSVF